MLEWWLLSYSDKISGRYMLYLHNPTHMPHMLITISLAIQQKITLLSYLISMFAHVNLAVIHYGFIAPVLSTNMFKLCAHVLITMSLAIQQKIT